MNLSNPKSKIQNPKSTRVLILHTRYRQPGGEDVVVAAQAKLLRDSGHQVHLLEKHNSEIDNYGLFGKIGLFFQMADNSSAAAEVVRIIREFKPHVAHIHNTLPLLSPSVYSPLNAAGVKVIQYLHNYRLACAAGTLYRDGQPCTLCVDGSLKHAVQYRCWNDSRMASLGFTRMLERHRRKRTWHTRVDLFVALNTYMRDLLVQKHLVPEGKIVVQPNFSYVAQHNEEEKKSQTAPLVSPPLEKGGWGGRSAHALSFSSRGEKQSHPRSLPRSRRRIRLRRPAYSGKRDCHSAEGTPAIERRGALNHRRWSLS